jgi:type I restriction enzyme S subunit
VTLIPYPAYRESGIDIISVLPSHWETSKVANIARTGYRTFIDGDWIESPYITEKGIRLIQTGNVGVGVYKEQGFRYVAEETFRLLHCTEVSPNDVLICRLADPVGRACLAPDLGVKMITSVDVCILKVSEDWEKRYITYFLSSKPYLDLMGAVSRGSTRDRISRSFLGNVRIAKPSLSEQTAIADFLDRETAEADALVAKYERLIELLEEKRVALITQAVTKGLDPNVPMKDSGVDWIGDIPAHWENRKLKFLARLRYGLGQPPAESADGLPFVRATNIDQGTISRTDIVLVDPLSVPKGRNAFLKTGEIIIVRSGALTGDSAIVPPEFAGAVAGFDIVIDSHDVVPEYLAWCLLSPFVRRAQIDLLKTRAAQPHLNVEDVGSVVICVPPTAEQSDIADHIKVKNADVRAIQSGASRAIALIKEHRAAIITAAVTGQIDVLNYKSTEPPVEVNV